MKPMAVKLRPRARADLFDIWNWIAAENVLAADRVLDRIDAGIAMLAEYPEAGRARPELHLGLRSHVVGQHLVFYCQVRGGIEIVRVVNGAMDFDESDFR